MVKKWLFSIAMVISSMAHGQVFVRTNDVLSLSPTANPMQWTAGAPIRYTVYLRQGSIAVDLSGTFGVWLISDRRDGLVIRSNTMTTVSATNGCLTYETTTIPYDGGDFYRSTVQIYSDAGVFQYTAAIDNASLSSAAIDFGITDTTAYRGDWGDAASNKAAMALQPGASITSLVGYGTAALLDSTNFALYLQGVEQDNAGAYIIWRGDGFDRSVLVPWDTYANISDYSGVPTSNGIPWISNNYGRYGLRMATKQEVVDFVDGVGATNIELNTFITNFTYNTTSRTFTIQGSGGGGALSVTVTNVVTNYTAMVGNLVLADTSANPITITMPAATGNMGKEISCRIMSSSNLLTIEPVAGDTINGESSIGLSIAGNAVDMISDGFTNWWVK